MFNKSRIALGQGFLDRVTVFEFKRLFSLYVHVFNTVAQDRFHTHAFNGLAFVVRGGYFEEYKTNDKVHVKWVGPGIRFIPKKYNHRLLKSKPNTISILITGPWTRYWTEEKEGMIRTLTWGRKVVKMLSAKKIMD